MERACFVKSNDTVDTLCSRFMYPEGIKASEESVRLIVGEQEPRLEQPEEGVKWYRGTDDNTEGIRCELDLRALSLSFI